jgi:hypothetical protein
MAVRVVKTPSGRIWNQSNLIFDYEACLIELNQQRRPNSSAEYIYTKSYVVFWKQNALELRN